MIKKFTNKKLLLLKFIDIIFGLVVIVLQARVFKYLFDVITGVNKNGTYKEVLIIFAIVTFIDAGRSYYKKYYGVLYSRDMTKKITMALFDKYINMDFGRFVKTDTGSKISVIINDVNTFINDYLNVIFNLITNISLIVVSIASIFFTNYMVGILMVVITIVCLLLPQLFEKKLRSEQKQISAYQQKSSNLVVDFLKGFYDIKSFGIERTIYNKFKKGQEDLDHSILKFTKSKAAVSSLSNIFGSLAFLGNMLVCGYFVYKNQMSMGDYIFCVQMSNYIGSPLIQAFTYMTDLKGSKAIKEKIENILSEPEVEKIEKVKMTSLSKSIKFENVYFSYDDKDFIKGLNLEFERGKKYAIVGFSGSGKSTLLKLISGEAEPREGSVLIDGLSIDDIDSESRMKLICQIRQNVFMFNGTLKENLTMYDESYSRDEIGVAIEEAGLTEVVKHLENGIDSELSENGGILSGGEKQRVSIARAILKDADVILCDEVLSALDNKMAYEIEKTLLSLESKTLISVTHRFTKNIVDYDEIIVVNHGNIVERGKAEDLIKQNGYFKVLYELSK